MGHPPRVDVVPPATAHLRQESEAEVLDEGDANQAGPSSSSSNSGTNTATERRPRRERPSPFDDDWDPFKPRIVFYDHGMVICSGMQRWSSYHKTWVPGNMPEPEPKPEPRYNPIVTTQEAPKQQEEKAETTNVVAATTATDSSQEDVQPRGNSRNAETQTQVATIEAEQNTKDKDVTKDASETASPAAVVPDVDRQRLATTVTEGEGRQPLPPREVSTTVQLTEDGMLMESSSVPPAFSARFQARAGRSLFSYGPLTSQEPASRAVLWDRSPLKAEAVAAVAAVSAAPRADAEIAKGKGDNKENEEAEDPPVLAEPPHDVKPSRIKAQSVESVDDDSKYWKVVCESPKEGLAVRVSRFAWAPEFRDRLRDSAVVRQMWLSRDGLDLEYELFSGTGPEKGVVSLKTGPSKALLCRCSPDTGELLDQSQSPPQEEPPEELPPKRPEHDPPPTILAVPTPTPTPTQTPPSTIVVAAPPGPPPAIAVPPSPPPAVAVPPKPKPANGVPLSPRSAAAAAQQQQQCDDSRRHIIIFDWDDTLCPTSWLDREPEFKDVFDKGSLAFAARVANNPFLAAKLEALDVTVTELLKLALRLGRVGIVTLAQRPWVTSAAKAALPKAAELLDDIEIFYARDQVVQQSPPGATGAYPFIQQKRGAMQQMIDTCSRHCGRSEWDALVSIGDSDVERVAATQLGEESQRNGIIKALKVVKFANGPDIEKLKSQLENLRPKMEQLVSEPGYKFISPMDLTPRR